MNERVLPIPTFPMPHWPFPSDPEQPFPIPLGPTGPFAPTNRSSGAGADNFLPYIVAGPELLKRLYCRPDYQYVIRVFGEVLLRELEQDPEALEAFRDLLERHGISFAESADSERIAPLVAGLIVGGAFVAGGVLGYFAEEGKADNK